MSLILVVDHKAVSLIVISFPNLKHNDNIRGHVITYNVKTNCLQKDNC
jgi:hypothetical protein